MSKINKPLVTLDKPTVDDLEEFAANQVRPFTSADVAKALHISVQSAAALLACRSRNGRKSRITQTEDGRWHYFREVFRSDPPENKTEEVFLRSVLDLGMVRAEELMGKLRRLATA